MTTTHADSHDLDKLTRWQHELSSAESNSFPSHAVFLVSAEDQTAHDIFRTYRSRFQDLSAAFHHLVIFGQHGVSSTVRHMVPRLGLGVSPLPVLVLFQAASDAEVYSLPLPSGDSEEDRRWEDVLAVVESAARKGTGVAGLDLLPGIGVHHIPAGTVADLINGLLQNLSAPTS